MALTGYRVGGPELYRLGIVEACTTPEELMATAREIAVTIASKSPVSTRMGKHTLNVIEDMSLRDGYRYEQDMTAIIGKTEDAKEAQLAFKEKRRSGLQRALSQPGRLAAGAARNALPVRNKSARYARDSIGLSTTRRPS